MKTIFSIVLLAIFGIAASFLALFALNIAGLPGALLAGKPGKRSKLQFKFGSAVAALGQSYLYLAYVAFIVNWAMRAARRDDVVFGFLLWPVALLAVLIPIWINFIRGRVEAKEVMQQTGHANPQVEALQYTVMTAFIGFFLFAFVPSVMRLGWFWVPYVDRPK